MRMHLCESLFGPPEAEPTAGLFLKQHIRPKMQLCRNLYKTSINLNKAVTRQCNLLTFTACTSGDFLSVTVLQSLRSQLQQRLQITSAVRKCSQKQERDSLFKIFLYSLFQNTKETENLCTFRSLFQSFIMRQVIKQAAYISQ